MIDRPSQQYPASGLNYCSPEWLEREDMRRQQVVLPIEGLGVGGGGALTVERALMRASGVTWVFVSPPTEMAFVEYDPAVTSPQELAAVIEGVGFGTTTMA